MRALTVWLVIMILAVWCAIGLTLALVWMVPTWALTAIIKWGLDK